MVYLFFTAFFKYQEQTHYHLTNLQGQTAIKNSK